MRSPSGVRSALRSEGSFSLLVAHDATLGACKPLVERVMTVERVARGTVVVTSSAQDAAEQLRRARDGKLRFDAAFVCLDLQPAPLAGTRIADFAIRQSIPVVLVTRSLRWLPPDARHLQRLPWLSPDADVDAVSAALADALGSSPSLLEADLAEDRVSIGF